jgi:hypothetical protein
MEVLELLIQAVAVVVLVQVAHLHIRQGVVVTVVQE